MYKALKTKVKLNNQQKTLMAQHAGYPRWVYNWGVERVFKVFRKILDPPQPPLIRGEPYSKSPFFKGDNGGSPRQENTP